MNKLEGFYELRRRGLPAVPWRPFTGNEDLDSNLLWTIRVAVQSGEDFNLPRAVGVDADEATAKAREYLAQFAADDLVVYYPYFIALKSGIIEIQADQTVIEAVDGDLWNLTTLGRKNITIIIDNMTGNISKFGNPLFLDDAEAVELQTYAHKLRIIYRDYVYAGKPVILEWSYAFNTNINREKIGEKYLVFIECKVASRTK